DQAEAFAMADAIGVMERGRILQWADAATLYAHPCDPFVAGFIGRGCVLPAEALGLEGGGRVLLRPDRLLPEPAGATLAEGAGGRRVRRRPDRRLPDPAGAVLAEVGAVSFRGPGRVALLRLGSGQMVEADLPADVMQAPGTMLGLRLADGGLVRFP